MANPATGPNVAASGFDLVPITPSNDDDLPIPARAIRCKPATGVAGTLRITTRAGEERDTEIEPGEQLDVYVIKVHDTGTTATGLEAII